MADKIATRESYGNALAELGDKYENLIVFDADLAAATKTGTFKKKFPNRHFDCGIAEGNMVAAAAGASTTGLIPFVSSFAMFTAGRAFEQIRNAVGYPHLNVKIGATHAGISVGEDGATHQCCEDIGTMRTIPGMVILNPADDTTAYMAVEAAINHVGPVYLRFGRLAVPVIYDKNTKFEIGRGIVLAEGKDVAVIASGLMVHEALAAKEILANEGISAEIIDIHTIKPIDRELVTAAAAKCGAVVTAEEHNIIGGLGSAVCEVLAETNPVPVLRVGVNDEFGRSGKVPPLMQMYGLTAADIVAKAKAAIALKK